jgi:acetyltransferase-like isoleucine patch superfamily enzyme
MQEAVGATATTPGAGRARRLLGRACVRLYRLTRRAANKGFALAAGGAFDAFGERSVLELPIRLQGERRIAIGSGVFVGSGSWLQVLDEAGSGAALTIGDGTSIAGACVLSAARSLRVGRHVLMARNVYIADHMHRFDDTRLPVLQQGVTRVAPVVIGDGAWLGENVVVGPGVTVGRGAVVGANAVVLADVPDYGVAVGVPARVVRTLAPPGGDGAPEG